MDSWANQLKDALYDSCKALREFVAGYDVEFVTLANALFRLMNDEEGQDELARHIRNQLSFLRGNLWEANRRLTELAQKMNIPLPPMRIPPIPDGYEVETLTVSLDKISRGFEQFCANLELCQKVMKGQKQ